MKKIYLLATVAILALGCGSNSESKTDEIIASKDIKKIKEQRELINKELKTVAAELAKLDASINELSGVKNIVLVKTNTIKKELFTHSIEIIGNVETKENILISPETNGVLTQLRVKSGQKVSKGQIVAMVDDGGLAAQLEQTKTQLALAKTTYERQQNLWNQKIGSEIQYLQAKTAYEAQEKAVKQMQSMLEKTYVKAPFSGTIEDVTVERGQVVSPGLPLMRIVNINNMYVQAQVPETYLSNIKLNSPVEVLVKSLGKTYIGKIRQIDNYIKPNNRSFGIEIALDNKENLLRPNQTAILKIEDYINNDAILIPNSALIEAADKKFNVFVAGKSNAKKEATVSKKEVEIGISSEGKVEILKGLEEEQRVIIEGVRSLKDNMTVQVVE
jgi:RND family efflux transporter MFP subunit